MLQLYCPRHLSAGDLGAVHGHGNYPPSVVKGVLLWSSDGTGLQGLAVGLLEKKWR